ncbi:MAG TPA: CPBP family intramembrane glutamic endopeptidase, partial [Bacteroidota bacterium]|nr:CPBP family intramembrane glutamic endopeptidase [Bacteroidota bacterium]
MTDSFHTMLPPEPPREKQSFLERHAISPVLFAFICLLIVFVLYQLVGGFITLMVVGSKVTPANVMMHRLFTMGGQILFILLPTIVCARLLDRRFSGVFPWRMPHIGESIFAVLSLMFLQEVLQIYLFFQDRIPLPQGLKDVVEPAKQMVEEMFRILVSAHGVPELMWVLLVVSITPAVVEELLFRGLVQSSFERRMKPVKAAIWTGVIFGLFHFNPFALVPLVVLGCFFGILRMRSRSMVIAMTLHFLNNGLAVIVSYFNMDDKMVLG